MLQVKRYTDSLKKQWNAFAAAACNSTFLFQRDFMDYHQDRFKDYSLLVYNNEKLVALLPANVLENIVYSHQGLSYGGLLINKLYLKDYFSIFEAVLMYLYKSNIQKLQLNPIPHFYNKEISQEIDYALFILKATRNRADAYFVVNTKKYKMNRNRKRALILAKENQLEFVESADFNSFWNLLSNNLEQRYGAKPTHSLDEITLLYSRFSKSIKLFEVRKNRQILAGAVLFLINDVAHIQYSSANDLRQETGSMDFLFDEIIKHYKTKKHVSFGISGEEQGKYVNEGLAYFKQSFGARVAVQNYYEIETANHPLLKTVFR
jgi:hypothetical protein